MPDDGEVRLAVRPELDVGALRKTSGAVEAEFETSTKKVGSKFQALGGTIGSSLGQAFTSPQAAAVTAVAVIGGGLYKLGSDFDSAYDKIRTSTGATGEQLKGLEGSFRNVVKAVPTDFGKASEAIAGLQQRTGLAGKPLEDLSKQVLNLNRLTGSDLTGSIDKLTRMLGDAGIPADKMSTTLDKVFVASQKSGVSFDKLAEGATKFGGPMRQLGFSFEDTVGLLAKFEKEGVNTDLVMGSLRIALGKMAKGGVDAHEGLTKTFDAIKNAKTPSEATAKAIELFGQKAGPDMAAAIREGRFSIDDLKTAMDGAGGSINKTAADTADGQERMQLAFNRAKVALEPLATAMFEFGSKLIEKVAPAIEAIASWIGKLADVFKTEGFAGLIQKLADDWGDLWPKIQTKLGELLAALGKWIVDEGPGILRRLGEWTLAFEKWVYLDVYPKIAIWLGDLALKLFDWIKENGPGILRQLGEWTTQFLGWAVDMGAKLLGALGDWMQTTVLPWIADQAPKWLAALGEWTLRFLAWAADMGLQLLGKLADWIERTVLPWIADQAPKILIKLGIWTDQFLGWVADTSVALLKKLPGLLADLTGWILDVAPKILEKLGEWTLQFLAFAAELGGKLVVKLVDAQLALLGWIAETALKIPGKLLEWTGKFTEWVVGLPAKILEAGADLVGWIGQQASKIPGQLVQWTTEFTNWVGGLASSIAGVITSFVSNVGQSIVDFIKDHIPTLFGGNNGVQSHATTPTSGTPDETATDQNGNFYDRYGSTWYRRNPDGSRGAALTNGTLRSTAGATINVGGGIGTGTTNSNGGAITSGAQVQQALASGADPATVAAQIIAANGGQGDLTAILGWVQGITASMGAGVAAAGAAIGATVGSAITAVAGGFIPDPDNGRPQMAAGGHVLSSGWSWVGEKGKELAYFPRGASVVPLERAGAFTPPRLTPTDLSALGLGGAAAGAGGRVNNFTVNTSAVVAMDEKELARTFVRLERMGVV